MTLTLNATLGVDIKVEQRVEHPFTQGEDYLTYFEIGAEKYLGKKLMRKMTLPEMEEQMTHVQSLLRLVDPSLAANPLLIFSL